MTEPQVDPANVKPGEQPPVPTTRDELLIEALRSADRVSVLLNEIASWCNQYQDSCADRTVDEPDPTVLEALVLRRFSDCSGVHLFIAAYNLRIALPPDIDGSGDENEHCSD